MMTSAERTLLGFIVEAIKKGWVRVDQESGMRHSETSDEIIISLRINGQSRVWLSHVLRSK